MKKERRPKEWHAPKSPIGMGDFYGPGIKNPVGKMIDSYIDIIPKKGISTPPKKLA
jgi:hypothetical protein